MDNEKSKIYGGQVYYDPSLSQYYTAPYNQNLSSLYGNFPFQSASRRTYLNQPLFNSTPNQSMVGQMLANRQPYQYNAPSAQQMFPGMGNPMQGTMPQQSQGNPMLGGGNFGAGRFLGQNYANQTGLLGSPSTSMLGT